PTRGTAQPNAPASRRTSAPRPATTPPTTARRRPTCSRFFLNPPPTTEISTLSLHDALPISPRDRAIGCHAHDEGAFAGEKSHGLDRKSTRLNSSHSQISYAVFCLKKKKTISSPFGAHVLTVKPPPELVVPAASKPLFESSNA